MLPFLLFVAGVLVCACMYIADHRRALKRMEARSKFDTNERRHTIVMSFFMCMLLTGSVSKVLMVYPGIATPTASPVAASNHLSKP